MEIVAVPVTELEQNCRILIDEASQKAAVVDPGGDVDAIVAKVAELKIEVSVVLVTHAHFDHCGGAKALLRKLADKQGFAPAFMAHQSEQIMRGAIREQARMFGFMSPLYEDCPEPTRYLADEDTIQVGESTIKALYTPGHSGGHLAFYIEGQEPVLIAGDALFAGSIGRTDLPGGNYHTLIESIKNKFLTLPDNTRVMPGHGPDTTIGVEKRTNPFLQGER